MSLMAAAIAAEPAAKQPPAKQPAAPKKPAGPLATDEAQKTATLVPPREGKRETIVLFNGKDLTGWTGHVGKYWSVQDGVIVGKNTEPVAVSTYLLTERKFSDFRLTFDFKLAQAEMHSGVALWGRVAPERNDPYTYAGHLVMFPSNYGFYDLYGRNAIHRNADKARAVGKQHDWNKIEVLAQGNRIRFVLNGTLISDWREPEPDRIREAPIGLQLHSNKEPQEVQWKNITIETFPEDKLTTLAQAPGVGSSKSGSGTLTLTVQNTYTGSSVISGGVLVLNTQNTFAGSSVISAPQASKYRVYFGTYTRGGKSEGIYRSEFDPTTGQLSAPVLAAKTQDPSFLVVHPSKKFVFAVGESGAPRAKGAPPAAGAVSAFEVDPTTGDLELLNEQSSHTSGPCHISIDKAGKFVLIANYGGGGCGVLPIGDDGRLGPVQSYQQHTGTGGYAIRPNPPRAHSINLDPANRFAICADAGIDQLMIYRFDAASGTLTPNTPPSVTTGPAAAPRHTAFHPSGRFFYAINEHTCTMTAFEYDAEKGKLTELQKISTLPPGEIVQKGYSTAEVVCHPSGRFLYGSNRGQNSIVAYAIDESTGKLTLVGHQGEGVKTPRNFNVDPTGKFCLVENQDGGNVLVFTIDPQSGALTKVVCTIEIANAVCAKFVALD
jgi:6-phosphogluconolactonase